MKKAILASVLALACAFAHGAYPIQGADSTAIGNSAGKEAYAHRTVVIGTGAGAFMYNCDSNLFIGAASGIAARNVKETSGIGHYSFRGVTNINACVGMGDNTFRGATGLTRCVGIGQGVFAGRRDAHDEVNINNQIVVGEFKSGPDTVSGLLIEGRDGMDLLKVYDDWRGDRICIIDCATRKDGEISPGFFIVADAQIQARDLYLNHGIYLKKGEDGKVHVYEGDTDLGYITPTK